MASSTASSAAKLAALGALLVLYWRPVDVATAVAFPAPEGGFKEIHEHVVRFILTATSYSWALSSSSPWFKWILVIIAVQTVCWASFLAQESVFGSTLAGVIDRQTEKEYSQHGAVVAFGLLLFIVLFGGRASARDIYRHRLHAFYLKHNRDKIADIDKILKKYEGNEELLFARLQRKYSVLSHTAVENAVDEVGDDGDDEGDANEQEFIEEVEYIQPLQTGDSEDDDTLRIIKPRIKSPATKPPSHPASPATRISSHPPTPSKLPSHPPTPSKPPSHPASPAVKIPSHPSTPSSQPTSSGALRSPTPPRSPSISESKTVRSAIEDARRAQEERVQQRVAQLESRRKK